MEDIYEDLRQWGMWQRTIQRLNLAYSQGQYHESNGRVKSTIEPIYRDFKSEGLDLKMAQYLNQDYLKILVLSFVDLQPNTLSAFSMGVSVTTYKARRREAMAILIGINCVCRLDRSTRVG